MKVNSIDIKKYGGRQMTVVFAPANRTTENEWNKGQRLPTEFDTIVDFSTCTLVIYFVGSDRNDVIRKISKFLSLFDSSVIVELDKYKGKYKGFLKSQSITDTKEIRKKKLSITLDGYMFDEQIEVKVNGTTAEPVELVGSREAPCVIEITATKELKNLAIKGFGSDDIIIESIKENETIKIDGIIGTATANGENVFNRVDMWELPYIKKTTLISLSDENSYMTIKYNPMWV